MKERILELVAALNMSMRSFSFKIKKSESYVRNLRPNVGLDVVSNILLTFPNVNPYWLILGSGDMFIEQKELNTNSTTHSNNTSQVIGNNIVGDRAIVISLPETGTEKIIKSDGEVIIQSTEPSIRSAARLKKNDNADLKDKIALLEEIISSKNETIEILKKQLNI